MSIFFAHEKDYKETIVRTLEFTTIDGEFYKQEYPTNSWISNNDSVIVLYPLPTYGDVFEVSSDRDPNEYDYCYDGTTYWCVKIKDVIYMTRVSSRSIPDWATHYIYFSK